MCDEKIIIEVNPRTKEKKQIDLLDYQLFPNYTVRDLINEFELQKKQVALLNDIIKKLIDVVGNINTSTLIQIADIKEEIK